MSDAFISYSRCDTDFVRQVFWALNSCGRQVWVDWRGIDYSTKWWEEISAGIEGADNFVLIISPDSMQSVYCQREIEHARKHNKRIVSVLYRPIEEREMLGSWYTHLEMRPFEQIARDNWESIKTIQWIEYSKLGDIDKLVSALLNTVATDPELIRLHTRLLLRVRDWEMHGRTPDALLHGVELDDYERWLTECEQSELRPKPTSEQRVYISESRRIVDKIRKERETRDHFEALKGEALKKYVKPYLISRRQELMELIDQQKKKGVLQKFHFDSMLEQLKLELNEVENLLDDGGNWHPQPPKFVHSGGAMDDYIDVWEFPCCKKYVLGDALPLQFRQDGCETGCAEIRAKITNSAENFTKS